MPTWQHLAHQVCVYVCVCVFVCVCVCVCVCVSVCDYGLGRVWSVICAHAIKSIYAHVHVDWHCLCMLSILSVYIVPYQSCILCLVSILYILSTIYYIYPVYYMLNIIYILSMYMIPYQS